VQHEWDRIQAAANWLRTYTRGFTPDTGLIMGSGMGMLADEVSQPFIASYRDIPHFPVSTVEGHAGKLYMGMLSGKPVMLMQGRVHLYEGLPVQQLAFPVRVMQQLGVKTLILTNAAGGVNPEFQPGDLMLIRDHINFAFQNPLLGPHHPAYGPRFVDTSRTYSAALRQLAKNSGRQNGIKLHEGVYQFMTGPSYETPAEVHLARKLGADAIGMSTVPEALAAAQAGMQVLGISYISNQAAGISGEQLSHQEVIETMQSIKLTFIHLLTTIVANL